jgi:hypothetical protein
MAPGQRFLSDEGQHTLPRLPERRESSAVSSGVGGRMTTEQWQERIEMVRAREGIDGRVDAWVTFARRLPPAWRLVTRLPRPRCAWCDRPLTRRQIRDQNRCCSLSCAQHTRCADRRSA